MIRAALRHPVPRNKLITTVALLTVATAVATAPPARGQGSPMEYFAEQEAENKEKNTAVFAATSMEELIEIGATPSYLDASFMKQLSAEQNAEIVTQIKDNLDTKRAVAERIEGDRAAVLRETSRVFGFDTSMLGVDAWSAIVEMSLQDGSWQPVGEKLIRILPGVRSDFIVSGAWEHETTIGLIEPVFHRAGDSAIPVFRIMDAMGAALRQEKHAAELNIQPMGCLEVGSYPIEPEDRDTLFLDRASRGSAINAEVLENGQEFTQLRRFDHEVSGTLEVTAVDGDRFEARFEFSAANKKNPGETVTVTGTLTNALRPCALLAAPAEIPD